MSQTKQKTPSKWKMAIRLGIFFLCPVYIIWSFVMGTGDIRLWSTENILAWVVLTLLWSAAWGFAGLAALRRVRMAKSYYSDPEHLKELNEEE